MKKFITKSAIVAGSMLPFFALAAEATQTVIDIIGDLSRIVSLLVPLVFTLAILAFFWGLMKYIFAQGSEDGKSDAKKIMIWAAIALFVMISIFGIIRLFQRTLDIDQSGPGTITIPTVVPPPTYR